MRSLCDVTEKLLHFIQELDILENSVKLLTTLNFSYIIKYEINRIYIRVNDSAHVPMFNSAFATRHY